MQARLEFSSLHIDPIAEAVTRQGGERLALVEHRLVFRW